MSEASRKRSRKSKLVPRDCAVDENDIELQVPDVKIIETKKQQTKKKPKINVPTTMKTEVCDTSVLKKINAAKDREEPTTPRKFEVDVEVETCDDEFYNGTLDFTEGRQSPINRHQNLINTLNYEEDMVQRVPITLTHENILIETNNILNESTNVADKILGFYIRNTIGFEVKIKLDLELHENLLQKALDKWRTWQFRSLHRENPLFYKCYICEKSWWYLSDFRDHITMHPVINIALEKYELHECNIIAYKKTKLGTFNDINTEGLCYRCGEDFQAHKLESRITQKYYGNSQECSKQFYTCTSFRNHVLSCSQCGNRDSKFTCSVCKLIFDTEDQLKKHLTVTHIVRTDIPILVHYNKCMLCLDRYSCSFLHVCSSNGPQLQCPHCSKNFLNKFSLKLHLDESKNMDNCEICEETLELSCQKYEHMLMHTANFMFVRRCVKCVGWSVFVNNESAMLHHSLKHEYGDMKHQGQFSKVLVPKPCIDSTLACLQNTETETAIEEFKRVVGESATSMVKQEFVTDNDQELKMEQNESKFEFGDVVVKEEPEEFDNIEESFIIKEEPFEEDETQEENTTDDNPEETFDTNIIVKEENDEEDYEEDIIKLNFDIEDLIVKQESNQNSSQESIDETLESDEDRDAEETVKKIKKGKMLDMKDSSTRRLYKCSKCGFTARHRLYRDHKDNDCLKTSLKSKHYECTICNTDFITLKKYLVHFTEHGYKLLSCPECLKQFQCFSKLGPHLLIHVKQSFVRVKLITTQGAADKQTEHQCTKCGAFTEINNFFKHWETHLKEFSAKKSHEIAEARMSRLKRVIDDNVLKECINRLHTMPKECNHCHHQFNRVNECKRHIIEHLLADAYAQKHIYGELRCQICDTGYPNQEKYKQHMREHASLPVYKCELCDRAFSDSSNFTKHKKVHNLTVIVCDLCGKKFQSKTSLLKHIEKHNTTAPITCTQCNKIFYFDSTYRRHVRYFHEKIALGYRCIICSERFETLKLKWDHMWEVHKERKNKADCPICFKSFRKYSDVRAHAKKDHNMEVSVICVKNATKSMEISKIHQFLNNSSSFQLSETETETLVVYDPDS